MRDLVSKIFTPVYHGAQQQKQNPDIIPGTQLTKIFSSGPKKKKTRAEDCTTLSHTATWLSRAMLAALHPTGGYVVGLGGALWEWGSALARTQAIGTELGDVGQGFQAFRGFRDSNGDCPPSPLAGSAFAQTPRPRIAIKCPQHGFPHSFCFGRRPTGTEHVRGIHVHRRASGVCSEH